MTTPAFPIALETDEDLETWVLAADGGSYLVFSEGTAWIAYQTENGDWFATRPAWDDDLRPDGTFPDGVTHSFEGLDLPVIIAASAEMPTETVDPITETPSDLDNAATCGHNDQTLTNEGLVHCEDCKRTFTPDPTEAA